MRSAPPEPGSAAAAGTGRCIGKAPSRAWVCAGTCQVPPHGKVCSKDAFVLESYGVGGIPEGEKYTFHAVLEDLIQKGKTVVLSTQAIYEGSDITVYRSGHMAKTEFGIMESYDMTLEATVTKLMWILGQTNQPAEIRRLYNVTIANDILSQEWDWEE